MPALLRWFSPHPDGPTEVAGDVAADLAARARRRARSLAWAGIAVNLPLFYIDDCINYAGGALADALGATVTVGLFVWRVVAVGSLGAFLVWERRQPAEADTRIAGGLAVWFALLGGAFGAFFWANDPSDALYGLTLLLVAVLIHAPSRASLWGYAGALGLALGGALVLGAPGLVVAEWSAIFALITGFAVFVDRALYAQAYRTATATYRLGRANTNLSAALDALGQAQARLVATEREAERLRISRDLHDSVGAQLSSLLAGVEVARLGGQSGAAIDDVAADAREALRQLRETVWTLSAAPVAAGTLAARLRQYAEARARHSSATITVTAGGDSATEIPADAALHVYRVGQEAIGNAVKHSGASAVCAALGVEGETLRLVVHDDGAFAAGDGADPLAGYGMRSMHDRADALGGHLALDTADGTRVELVVPLGVAGPGTGPGTRSDARRPTASPAAPA